MAHRIGKLCRSCGVCLKICPTGAIAVEKNRVPSIDENLCIDCGACGRVCPFGAVLDPFGIPCVFMRKDDWPKPHINVKKCLSCGICLSACPVHCFAWGNLPEANSPHPFPLLDRNRQCIGCGFCVEECPVGAVTMEG